MPNDTPLTDEEARTIVANLGRGYEHRDSLFVKRLRDVGLSTVQVAGVLEAISATCCHCYDDDAATCCCWNDE